MATTLRMLGSRVLLKPITAAPRSEIIALTDKAWTFAAEVVSLGRPRCASCAQPLTVDLAVGDRVYVPASKGHEITMNGETFWVLDFEDIGGLFVEEPHA